MVPLRTDIGQLCSWLVKMTWELVSTKTPWVKSGFMSCREKKKKKSKAKTKTEKKENTLQPTHFSELIWNFQRFGPANQKTTINTHCGGHIRITTFVLWICRQVREIRSWMLWSHCKDLEFCWATGQTCVSAKQHVQDYGCVKSIFPCECWNRFTMNF